MIVVFMTLSVGKSDHVQELAWEVTKLETLILNGKINYPEALLRLMRTNQSLFICPCHGHGHGQGLKVSCSRKLA